MINVEFSDDEMTELIECVDIVLNDCGWNKRTAALKAKLINALQVSKIPQAHAATEHRSINR